MTSVESSRCLTKCPVPVRLIPLIATLIPQRGLPFLDKLAMPVEEDPVEVDRETLVDVQSDEVVEVRLGAWKVGYRGEGLHTEDGVDVVAALSRGQVTPFLAHLGRVVRASLCEDELASSRS